MQYGRIPGVDRPVSRIVFGTATPKLFAAFRSVHGGEPDFQEKLDAAFELLDTVYALGINCFDSADHYGEEPLGEWIASRGLAGKVVVLTKGAHHNAWRKRVTPFDILHDAHNSLAKLKVDTLDIYLLHRDDPEVPVGPIKDTLNQLHREGKIGAFGASNWSLKRIQEANAYATERGMVPFTAVSPNFGLAVQASDPWGGGCTSLNGAQYEADRAYFYTRGMPVFAYSPLARGLFSGRFTAAHPGDAERYMDAAGIKGYLTSDNLERLRRCEVLAEKLHCTVSQVATAWLFNQPRVDTYALTGATSKQHLIENIEAVELRLTEAQCQWLNLEAEAWQ